MLVGQELRPAGVVHDLGEEISARCPLPAAGPGSRFRPGLLGGHCIGVDPYYLTHKAAKVGYIPQVILSGRRINDNMGRYVARATVKKMVQNGIDLTQVTIGVMGLTFKENCPDLRNSRVIDILTELQDYGLNVIVEDAWADPAEFAPEHSGLEIALMLLRAIAAFSGVDLWSVVEGFRSRRLFTRDRPPDLDVALVQFRLDGRSTWFLKFDRIASLPRKLGTASTEHEAPGTGTRHTGLGTRYSGVRAPPSDRPFRSQRQSLRGTLMAHSGVKNPDNPQHGTTIAFSAMPLNIIEKIGETRA